MFHIVLFQPQIPPNTGNIIRLCANTGAKLHLIKPLGFDLDDKNLRRAGLDYHEYAEVKQYENLPDFISAVNPSRIFACSTKGQLYHTQVKFNSDDALLFGAETSGLPRDLLDQFTPESVIRIPMLATSRSLNLSNSVAVILYEALRQNNFVGLG